MKIEAGGDWQEATCFAQVVEYNPGFSVHSDGMRVGFEDSTVVPLENGSRSVKGGWRWWVLVWFAVWLGLIFWTSCYVVRPREFFGLIQQFTGAAPESMQRFELFWGVCWFAIVKGWHFGEFAILTLLCAGALRWLRGCLSTWSIIGAMAFCIAFAISDEWHQSFVPERVGSIEDVLIDCLGVGAAGAVLLMRVRQKRAAADR